MQIIPPQSIFPQKKFAPFYREKVICPFWSENFLNENTVSPDPFDLMGITQSFKFQ